MVEQTRADSNAPAGGNRVDEATLRALIAAGVQATSPDNGQPWQFVLHPDGFELRLDPARLGMFIDADHAASLMGCGAVLENVRLAASRHGLAATWQRLADPHAPERIARVRLAPSAQPADPLAAHVEARCSHRGHFNPRRAVSAASRDALSAAAASIDGMRLHWCRDAASRAAMRGAVVAADRVRFTCQRAHEEFHAKLRFGDDADRLADGLAADTLGIERIMLPILGALRPWPLTRALNRIGLHHVMAFRGAWVPIATAPDLGALVASADTDYIAAGQAIERTWIAAAAERLAFQALGALPLLLLRLRRCGEDGFEPWQVRALHRAEASVERAIPGFDPVQQWLVLVFRTGHARPPPARSRRRPVESFITPAPTRDTVEFGTCPGR